ncbi:hypothetical protein [Leisingera daeponensis]|uniref:hypothetical protein n=1 Tax=Leisingera daeponensis TaxID=405746 RepID=UPI001C96A6C9|nr:hypothetical protein [Leisingera daeponensis]MBY6059421.1 hypothetical protein [Leisingera daeponensis]
MTEHTKISVVTCTLGAEGLDTLLVCLNDQTRLPDSWIIKDCKPLEDPAQIERLKQTAKFPITYITQKDAGLSDGLNQAIDLVDSGLMSLLHNGDIYTPQFLEHMTQPLPPMTVRYCNVIWTRKGKVMFSRKAQPDLTLPLYDMPRINHPTFVADKDVYSKIGPFGTDLRIAMDFDWVARGMKIGVSFTHLDQDLYKMDAEGLSHSNFKRMRVEVQKIAKTHNTYTSELGMQMHWVKRWLKLNIKSLITRG